MDGNHKERMHLLVDPDTDTYGYASWNWHKNDLPTLSVVHSPGPDGRDDRPIVELQHDVSVLLASRKAAAAIAGTQGPLSEHLLRLVAADFYDPTNGLKSRGDLIMFSQWGAVQLGFGAK